MDFRKPSNRKVRIVVKAREVSSEQLMDTLTLFGRGVSKRRPDSVRAWKPRKLKITPRLTHYEGNGMWS